MPLVGKNMSKGRISEAVAHSRGAVKVWPGC